MRYIPTGNEYIALPTIRESDGAIESASVVLGRLDGLLEMAGEDAKPFLAWAGENTGRGPLAWRLSQDWIPFFAPIADAGAEGAVCAPPDQRFFLYRAPGGSGAVRYTLNFGRLFQTINVRHALPGWTCRIEAFNWSYTHGVVIDVFVGGLLLSVSLRCPGGAWYRCQANGENYSLERGQLAIETSRPFFIEVEPDADLDLVVGFGLSRVGARSADLEVGRVAADEWIARTEDWLARRAVRVADDAELSRKANRNGHFARFYAMARTLDTSAVVSMTSRSHRYYVSAAYWDRDSLLWLFPFLVRNDKAHALDLLRYAFGAQLAHAGIHSRQIGGQILEYGFELDELCAPLIALATWHSLYPADGLWDHEPFRAGAVDLLGRLRSWRCDGRALYYTELMPTDDLVVGGRDVLTYNNALVLNVLRGLLPFAERHAPHLVSWMRQDIAAIPTAIREHLVCDGVFQWSSDLQGSVEFYDEAAGSLMLLPHYGLCGVDDPVYRRTVETLYSARYAYFQHGAFSELGNRHTSGAPHPWVLSACNSVLSGVRRTQGLDFLRRAPMDGGIACESVNVETGLPESGLHFATCAGFVAHAIASGTDSYSNDHDNREGVRNGTLSAIH